MKMQRSVLYTLIFLLPVVIFASVPAKLFQEANELYQSNEFTSAIEKYEKIEADGYRSPELYYNLGNAYYKINSPGKSILNYERALLIANAESRNDIKYNLELARKNLPDEIEILPPFFLKKWKNNLRSLASAKSWSIAGLVLFWLGIGGFLVWLTGKTREQKKIGFVAGFGILILSFLPFYLAIDSVNFEKNNNLAVIMANEVDLRSAPDEVSNLILTLHEGTSVELLDQIGEWYKVKLLNGEKGWLPVKVLEKV